MKSEKIELSTIKEPLQRELFRRRECLSGQQHKLYLAKGLKDRIDDRVRRAERDTNEAREIYEELRKAICDIERSTGIKIYES